jgi:hypothetical protein
MSAPYPHLSSFHAFLSTTSSHTNFPNIATHSAWTPQSRQSYQLRFLSRFLSVAYIFVLAILIFTSPTNLPHPLPVFNPFSMGRSGCGCHSVTFGSRSTVRIQSYLPSSGSSKTPALSHSADSMQQILILITVKCYDGRVSITTMEFCTTMSQLRAQIHMQNCKLSRGSFTTLFLSRSTATPWGSPERLPDLPPSLAAILLAKDVLIHLPYAPVLPRLCPYQSHLEQIAIMVLHIWSLSSRGRLWFQRLLPLSYCMLQHVHFCGNGAHCQCKRNNLGRSHHENYPTFWLLPHMHP